MTCEHDLAEKETACADGMCPMCLADEIAALRSERDALKVVVQAAKYWRKSWPDEKDVLEAKEESCPCAICELIRACDALAGDE